MTQDAIDLKPLEPRPKLPWYFRMSTVVVAFLGVGPLALPLVWFHPRWSGKAKVITTAVVSVLSYYLWIGMAQALTNIKIYYEQAYQIMQGG